MRASWRDFLAVLVLLLLLSGIFYKTIFLGVPVSRIALLAHWDSFFDDQLHGQNMLLDPTTLLLYIPMYFLVGNIWRSGVLPLWNPMSGCGSPIVGDIESNIFSPWKLLFAAYPALKTYNLILVGEVGGALLGTYLLARILSLPRIAAVYAAITFSLCPDILYSLELTNGPAACFFPLVSVAFVLLARRINALTVAIAAGASCVLIFSGHPESAFFGIVSAVLLAVSLRLFGVFEPDSPRQSLSELVAARTKNLFKLACGIVVVGLFTFAFCAPVLLPFVEFLRNSECYKFVASSTDGGMSWQLILSSLLAPCFAGASPYLGIVLLPALGIGIFYHSKLWKALALSSLILFLITTQIGPVKVLFSHTPLANVTLFYALTSLLLALCLLGAYGVQCLCANAPTHRAATIFTALLCIIQIPLVMFVRACEHNSLAGLKFDIAIPLTVSRHSLVILCSLALAAFLLTKRIWNHPLLASCAVLAIAWLSMAPTVALSLPVRSPFIYRLKEPLVNIDFKNNRLVSLGEHLFRPNTNWVLDISDLRSEKSLFVKRYPEFMVACGARADSHMQIFDQVPTPTFDFAAVPYVFAQIPVIDIADESSANQIIATINTSPIPQRINSDLTLQDAKFNYLPDDSAISCDFIWQCTENPPPYSLQLTLSRVDDHKFIWCTDSLPLAEYPAQLNLGGYGPTQINISNDGMIHHHVPVLLPTWIAAGSKVHASMRLLDMHKSEWTADICSADFTVQQPAQVHRRFSLVKETRCSNGNIFRLYRNCNAVPQAYLVHNVITAANPAESLALITTPCFNPRIAAIVETSSVPAGIPKFAANALGLSLQEREDNVELQRPDTNSAVINFSTTRPGLLVLADTFYPGWQAYIDGAPVNIVHCNYLFKGVFVPEGKHKVEFKYLPTTFLVGSALALAALLAGIVAILRFKILR
jgi:hypothetical protein